MDWANVTKIHTPHLPNTIPPDENALYKDNLVTGNAFSAPEAVLLLVLTKGARPLGTRAPGMGELSKVIVDIAKRGGNVLFQYH